MDFTSCLMFIQYPMVTLSWVAHGPSIDWTLVYKIKIILCWVRIKMFPKSPTTPILQIFITYKDVFFILPILKIVFWEDMYDVYNTNNMDTICILSVHIQRRKLHWDVKTWNPWAFTVWSEDYWMTTKANISVTLTI